LKSRFPPFFPSFLTMDVPSPFLDISSPVTKQMVFIKWSAVDSFSGNFTHAADRPTEYYQWRPPVFLHVATALWFWLLSGTASSGQRRLTLNPEGVHCLTGIFYMMALTSLCHRQFPPIYPWAVVLEPRDTPEPPRRKNPPGMSIFPLHLAQSLLDLDPKKAHTFFLF